MCTKVNWCELKAVAESPNGCWCMFEVYVCVFCCWRWEYTFCVIRTTKTWAWLDQRLVMHYDNKQCARDYQLAAARAHGLWGGRLLGCCYCFVNSASAIGFIQTNCVSTTLPPFIKHQVCMYGALLWLWRQSLRMVHVFYIYVDDWQLFCWICVIFSFKIEACFQHEMFDEIIYGENVIKKAHNLWMFV